jgi:glycosyltransferase involved in cell wall biosynthesis
MIEQNEIMVSVCMITYNHENFISEAIEGVLMQNTNFKFELVIGEDFSTDRTRKIVQQYAAKYPNIIKALLPEENLGVRDNFLQTIEPCKGKYIALCEGDDYWIDPNKLQKQVDFLEANDEYVLSHTNGFFKTNEKLEDWHKWVNLEGYIPSSFYYGSVVRSCSVLLRTKHLEDFILILRDSNVKIVIDWILFAFFSTKGLVNYINEKTCVYRLNQYSVTNDKRYLSRLNHELDVIEVNKVLRDKIFIGCLNELYSNKYLENKTIHVKMKFAFNTFNYKLAKELRILINDKKILKYKFLSSNHLIFLMACLVKKIK